MTILPFKKTIYANVVYYPKRIRWWNRRLLGDLRSLFGGEDVKVTHDPKFLNLLVALGAFNNNAEARNAGYTNEMPKGYSEHVFSRHPTEKKRGFYLALYLFNP